MSPHVVAFSVLDKTLPEDGSGLLTSFQSFVEEPGSQSEGDPEEEAVSESIISEYHGEVAFATNHINLRPASEAGAMLRLLSMNVDMENMAEFAGATTFRQ